MQRAFREDVKTGSGDVKFPAGVLFDWPKHVFQRVAGNIGKTLSEATVTPEDMGKVFAAKVVKGGRSRTKKSQPGPKPPRRRAAKKE